MDNKKNPKEERGTENDILFSKCVKAGKRIYYIDVKCDRRGEYYLSMTESKRLKDQGDATHPVFEKHKIFLYREDLEKFQFAFNEAVEFARSQSESDGEHTAWNEDELSSCNCDNEEPEKEFKLDIEF